MVPELKKMKYLDRLLSLNLTNLETKRVRGNQIEMFKIVECLD